MSHEIDQTTQSILNALDKPAFIKKNDKLILSNEIFTQDGYTPKNYEVKAKEQGCYIEEKQLNDGMKLCQILNCDLQLLKISQQKLTKAMALL